MNKMKENTKYLKLQQEENNRKTSRRPKRCKDVANSCQIKDKHGIKRFLLQQVEVELKQVN